MCDDGIDRIDVHAAMAKFDLANPVERISGSSRTKYFQSSGRLYPARTVVFDAMKAKGVKAAVSSSDAVEMLAGLGFTCVGNMNWSWGEIVLACAILVEHDWGDPRKYRPRLAELSDLLRGSSVFARHVDKYRSPDSVLAKVENLRTMRPGYKGAPTKGGQETAAVAKAFYERPREMLELAEGIRIEWMSGPFEELGASRRWNAEPNDSASLVSAVEGALLRRIVTLRERDRSLREKKIRWSVAVRGNISCEACQFDFVCQYGDLGKGYVHVHHIIPLHYSGEVISTLDDLVLVCANCHVMIHRTRPWKTPGELRDAIRASWQS